jgi:hypothetical protein
MSPDQIKISVRRHANHINDRTVMRIVETNDIDAIIAAHEMYETTSAVYRDAIADVTIVDRPTQRSITARCQAPVREPRKLVDDEPWRIAELMRLDPQRIDRYDAIAFATWVLEHIPQANELNDMRAQLAERT